MTETIHTTICSSKTRLRGFPGIILSVILTCYAGYASAAYGTKAGDQPKVAIETANAIASQTIKERTP